MLKPIKLIGEQKNVLFLPPINPIQIKGVAGSGKTTVALYRAKHLLETYSNLFQKAKVVIFTYNKTLAKYIKALSTYIIGSSQGNSNGEESDAEQDSGIQVVTFHKWAFSFIEHNGIPLRWENNDGNVIEWRTVCGKEQLALIEQAKRKFSSYRIASKSSKFFQEEISWIKGKLFSDRSEYLQTKRVGRGTSDRVTKIDKEHIWDIYMEYQRLLRKFDKVDFDDYAIIALKIIENKPDFVPPYTHIIVDEAQDLSKAQILVISKLVSPETNSITIIADTAQRIYKSGFVWSEVGINVRGRRTVELKKNYRNPIRIARAAWSLLSNEPDNSDFTRIEAALKGGEKPKLVLFKDKKDQYMYILERLSELKENNGLASTVILHRTNAGVDSIKTFLKKKGVKVKLIKTNAAIDYNDDSVKVCTMSSIKGLEFDNVFIIDLNEGIIPHPEGFIEDNDELHLSTERRLLYTCMTRARKKLFLLCSSEPTRYIREINKDYLEIVNNS